MVKHCFNSIAVSLILNKMGQFVIRRQDDGTGTNAEIVSAYYRHIIIMSDYCPAICFFGAGANHHIAYRQVGTVRHRYNVNKTQTPYSFSYKPNSHIADNGNLSVSNSLFQN